MSGVNDHGRRTESQSAITVVKSPYHLLTLSHRVSPLALLAADCNGGAKSRIIPAILTMGSRWLSGRATRIGPVGGRPSIDHQVQPVLKMKSEDSD